MSYFASRPMEDFFIHPTSVQGSRRQLPTAPMQDPFLQHRRNFSYPIMDHTQVYKQALQEYHHERRSSSPRPDALKQSASPTSNLTYLNRKLNQWQGYTSEDERASSNDNDNLSAYSDEGISVASDLSFPEYLASSCSNAEQQCSQARVVQIQSVGRPRMISLPKLVTVPAQRSVIRLVDQTTEQERRRSSPARPQAFHFGHSSRMSQSSSSDASIGSSDADAISPTSTAPSSVDDDDSSDHSPQLRHKRTMSRHVPLMKAAQAVSPNSPIFSSTPMVTRSGSARTTDTMLSQNAPAQPQLRRVSKFGLNRAFTMGKSLVRKDAMETLKEPEVTAITPLSTRPRLDSRGTFSSKTKLVARGANERAPPIRLPPCPV